MNWYLGTMVYVILWWLIWFTLLPVGVKMPDTVEKGHVESAPTNPRLWIKALVAALIAGVLWGIIYYAIQSDWISFR